MTLTNGTRPVLEQGPDLVDRLEAPEPHEFDPRVAMLVEHYLHHLVDPHRCSSCRRDACSAQGRVMHLAARGKHQIVKDEDESQRRVRNPIRRKIVFGEAPAQHAREVHGAVRLHKRMQDAGKDAGNQRRKARRTVEAGILP